MDRLKRPFFMVLGLLVSGIGIIGAFLPVLPSTVFFIFAAFCFARSSPRLENWILNHSLFGPPVTAWQEHGAIPLMAKYFAFLGMAFGFGSFLYFVAPDLWLLVVVALFFIGSAVYVGSRPSGPRSE